MCGSKREAENTHGAHPRNSNTHCICNATAENGIRKPLAVRWFLNVFQREKQIYNRSLFFHMAGRIRPAG